MNQDKDYFAFISYQRKDEEWADWLRNKLEHYRLPSSVRKKDASLPKEIRPIFRDALELAGGVLAKEIETALQNSKFLIVICSPNSAKSPWVNKEIQTFIELGREDRIIPFIIDGTPSSDNEDTECFPPALRSLKGEKELLGININELSRDAASIKVVARMFGLKFDTLWQRYEREKKRKRWMIVGGALLFAFVSLGIGGYIARQNRELDTKNKEVIAERDRANSERDRANSERDRAESANASLLLANDSIKRQYTLIEQQRNEIAIERDNVKSANYAMQVNLSRILAKEASKLVDEGDSYLARLVALQALPPPLPYTKEAEAALRKASNYNSAILEGHTSYVYSVGFNKDGRYLLSSSWDGTIRFWNAATGKELTEQRMNNIHNGNIRVAAYSEDEKLMVSASDDRTLKIWRTDNHNRVKTLRGHTGWINSASFSPDGKHLISSDSETIVWDLDNYNEGDSVTVYPGISGCYSPNGHYFATFKRHYKDNSIFIWDAINGTLVNELKMAGSSSGSISFSPDSKRIVSSSKKGIIIWDVQKADSLFEIASEESVSHVTYSPNGLLIAASASDYTVKVWNAENGRLFRVFKGHRGNVDCITFSPDSKRIVSSSDDRTIRIWDIYNNYCVQPSFQAHSESKIVNSIEAMAFSPNGDLLVSSTNNGIKLWNVSEDGNLSLFKVLNKYIKNVSDVCFSLDGNYLYSTSDSIIIMRNIQNISIRTVGKHSKQVNSISLTPDGKSLLSCSDDKRVILWNLETDTSREYAPYPGAVYFVDISPNGKLAVSSYSPERKSEGMKIRIWNIEDGKTILEKAGNRGCFSPDGKYIAYVSAENHTVKILNISSLRVIAECKGHTDFIRHIAFTHNGRNIISTSKDGFTKVWDVVTGLEMASFPNETEECQLLNWGNVAITKPKDDSSLVISTIIGRIQVLRLLPLPRLIEDTRKQFKDLQLTHEERRK